MYKFSVWVFTCALMFLGLAGHAFSADVIWLGNSDISGATLSFGTATLKSGSITDSVGTGSIEATTSFVFESGSMSANIKGVATVNKTTSGTFTLSGTSTNPLIKVLGGTFRLGASERIANTSNLLVDGATLASSFNLNNFTETVQYAHFYNGGQLLGGGAAGTLKAEQYVLKDGSVIGARLVGASPTAALFSTSGTNSVNSTVTGSVAGTGLAAVNVSGGSTLAGSGSLTANQFVLDNGIIGGTLTLLADDTVAAKPSVLFSLDPGIINPTNQLNRNLTVKQVRVEEGSTLTGSGTLTANQFVLNEGTLAGGVGSLTLVATGTDPGLFSQGTGVTTNTFNNTLTGLTAVSVSGGSTLAGSGSLTANQFVLDNGIIGGNLTLLADDTVAAKPSVLFSLDPGTINPTNQLNRNLTVKQVRVEEGSTLTGPVTATLTANQYVLNEGTLAAGLTLGVTGTAPGLFSQGAGTNTFNNTLTGLQAVSVSGGSTLTGTGGSLTANQFVLDGGTLDGAGTLVLAVSEPDPLNPSSGLFSQGTGTNTFSNTLTGLQAVSVSEGSTLAGSGSLTANQFVLDDGTLGGTLALTSTGSVSAPSVLFSVDTAGGAAATNTLNRNLTVDQVRVEDGSTLTGTSTLTANQFVLDGGTLDGAGTLVLAVSEPDPLNPSSGLFSQGTGTNTLNNTLAVQGVSVSEGSTLDGSGSLTANQFVLDDGTLESGLTLAVSEADPANPTSVLFSLDTAAAGVTNQMNNTLAVKQVRVEDGSTLDGTGTLTANQFVLNDGTLDGALTLVVSEPDPANPSSGLFSQGTGTNTLNNTLAVEGVSVSEGSTLQLLGSNLLDAGVKVYIDASNLDIQGDQTVGLLSGSGGVVLGGTLTTGGSNQSTLFSGVISESGGARDLVKEGTGAFYLTGANTYTGLTTVNNGHLVMNGSLASDLLIEAGGNLWGNGSISGTVTNRGQILPGNSIGTITVGNLVSDPGSNFIIEVDDAGNSDLINVLGTATLNGGNVDVVALSGSYSKRQYDYVIINAAGGVTGNFATITANSSALSPVLVYDDPNLIQLLITVNNLNMATFAGAQTANQISVASILSAANKLVYSGDMNDILNVFIDTLDAPGRRAALDELGGQKLYTAIPMVSFGLLESFNRAIGGRMTRLQEMSRMDEAELHPLDSIILSMAGEEPDLSPVNNKGQRDRNVWAHVYGADGAVERDRNAAGYDYRLSGVTLGVDFPVNKELSLGFSAGYGLGDVETEKHDDADITSIQAGIYGSYVNGGFYLDGLLSYADNDYDTKRSISFAQTSRVAKGDYDGREWSVAAEVGYVNGVGQFNVQPFFGMSFTRLDEDGLNEKGAGDISLHIAEASTESWKLTPGVRVNRPMKFGESSLFVPEFSARVVRELRDNNAEMAANFVGVPAAGRFRVDGIDIDRNSLELEIGFKLLGGEAYQVGLGVGTEINRDKTVYSASGNFKYMW